MSYHLCTIVEGTKLELRDLSHYCTSIRGLGFDRDLIVDAFYAMYSAITGFIKFFSSETRRIFGLRLRIDSPPPRIVGSHLLTGFWSGIFEYAMRDKLVRIIILPRLRNYTRMLRVADEVLLGISRRFYLLSRISMAASTTISIHPVFLRLLVELNRLLLYEQRRICRYDHGASGTRILFNGFNVNGEPLYTALKHICSPNKTFLTTIVLTIREMAHILRMVEEVGKTDLARIIQQAEYADKAPQLLSLIEKYVLELRRTLEFLLSDEIVQQALAITDLELEGLEKYSHILTAIHRLRKGAAYSLLRDVTGRERARFILFPSTKLYELYVYANILQALANGDGYLYREPLTVDVVGKGVSAYFNHVDPSMSRFIAPLIRRAPTPDIVLSSNGKVVVVDAKYRDINEKRIRLTLGDVERLAAYLLDVAKDTRLLATIVALKKPKEKIIEHVRKKIKAIDSKIIDVEFIELNPDTEEDPYNKLKPLIEYLTGS